MIAIIRIIWAMIWDNKTRKHDWRVMGKMHKQTTSLILLALLALTGCSSITYGPLTVRSLGTDVNVDSAQWVKTTQPNGTTTEALTVQGGKRNATDSVHTVAKITAAKSAALKNAENNFLSLCDLLTSSTSHTKLGFTELYAIIELLPQEQQVVIGVKLLAVDAEAKREGGLKWWDDCVWHTDIP